MALHCHSTVDTPTEVKVVMSSLPVFISISIQWGVPVYTSLYTVAEVAPMTRLLPGNAVEDKWRVTNGRRGVSPVTYKRSQARRETLQSRGEWFINHSVIIAVFSMVVVVSSTERLSETPTPRHSETKRVKVMVADHRDEVAILVLQYPIANLATI